jgi:hypothetical protein
MRIRQGFYKYRVFKKELYYVTPNITVWGVLRKLLHLKAFKTG